MASMKARFGRHYCFLSLLLLTLMSCAKPPSLPDELKAEKIALAIAARETEREFPTPGAAIALPPQIIRTITRDESPEDTDGDAGKGREKAETSEMDYLFPTGAETARFPSDFAIGPMEADDGASDECRKAASAFLEAMVSGKGWEGYLTSGSRGRLSEEKQRVTGLGAERSRFGSAKSLPDGGISFLIRFLGTEKSVSGELILLKEGEAWKVDDLLLDPEDTLRSGRTTPFNPLDYRQIFD